MHVVYCVYRFLQIAFEKREFERKENFYFVQSCSECEESEERRRGERRFVLRGEWSVSITTRAKIERARKRASGVIFSGLLYTDLGSTDPGFK